MSTQVKIQTAGKTFPTAPHLYGLFFEDINRSGDGGLYPEMIRNRAFEDSVPPPRVKVDEDEAYFTTPQGFHESFHHGEGAASWIRKDKIAYTPVPAWYEDGAKMTLNREDTLNPHRLCALDVDFTPGGAVYNVGFVGVPQKKGEVYRFYMFAKGIDAPVTVEVSIESETGTVYGKAAFVLSDKGYARYDAAFAAVADDSHARLVLRAPEGGKARFGFTSLMPADTYNGHGMRRDLMEILAGIHPKFLRFPGGCIVEGFSYETAMRFPNTIGPVWERPSHHVMWHYRATNGLGFHEYLQICEDLDIEPLYVINCGLTCQGRYPELFEGEELDKLLQEALDAIDYATAPADTKWGKIRAEMGHPEPFRMTYIEIGNENHGEEYNVRYKKFYDALKAAHPEIIYISNTHTEKDGLPTEVADEHFYNNTEFFAENLHKYDKYPRQAENGPEIFVGEFAVTVGATGKLYAALGEAMFMIGMERNQDIVKLASYAPLFEHCHYTGWGPNLIVFDNTRAYTIPSYSVWKLFGANRGDTVVPVEQTEEAIRYTVHGLPSILGLAGTKFRNPVWNGKPASVSHEVLGSVTEENGVYTTQPGEVVGVHPNMAPMLKTRTFITLGEGEDCVDGTFEVELFAEEGKELSIGLFTCGGVPVMHWTNHAVDPSAWSISSLLPFRWNIRNGVSFMSYGRILGNKIVSEEVPVTLNYGAFNRFRYETTKDEMRLYLNGELIQTVPVPTFPKAAVAATLDGDDLLIKLVNLSNAPCPIDVSLDCDVEPDFTVASVDGDPETRNSLDEPHNVDVREYKATGAAHAFTYTAPASCAQVLRLKRK